VHCSRVRRGSIPAPEKQPFPSGRNGSSLCENSRDRFLPVNFSHVDAISGDISAPIRLLAILRGGRNVFSHGLGQVRTLRDVVVTVRGQLAEFNPTLTGS
jgi:hypothetical protein